MAFVTLISEFSIGGFTFRGAHEVRIRRSMHSVAQTAEIVLPAFCRVQSAGKQTAALVSTRTLFNDGDAVSINIGYRLDRQGGNDYSGLNNEFTGFVKSRGLGLPMVMECEGYERQLRQNVNVSKNYTGSNTTTAKALLALATAGTDVTVECPVDFKISGVRLVNANGVEICDFIKQASDKALTIYFKNAKTLWCGLVYTDYAGGENGVTSSMAKYTIGRNCLRDNGLKMRIPSEPVQVKYNGRLANGTVVETASKNKAAANKLKGLLSHVPEEGAIKSFAQEKEYLANYTGYEGKLTAFLQPYCDVAYSLQITDNRNSDMNGTYLCETMDVTYGVRGARRSLEV